MNETSLPEEIHTNLEALLNKKYAIFLDKRIFSISSSLTDAEIRVCVTLHDDKHSFHYPVEARINPDPEEMTEQQTAVFLIDYIDLYFEQYFEEGEELLLPIAWAKHHYEAVEFELRGQIQNKYLEEQADKLLENQLH